eukprot:CAMPEP_0184744614 /NCGR_PEP_ID=MMETSP0315-20130426/7321_1 /TAXON_ID=101924 /ORGANISM="Rhodosorus marinus, Strain UTEX LB 2760" /LENGTH=184 /DNA_ID=CAMNT_0027216365 /DNA_START=224 /DNA_END=778 /DNA_ORIENTATION=+
MPWTPSARRGMGCPTRGAFRGYQKQRFGKNATGITRVDSIRAHGHGSYESFAKSVLKPDINGLPVRKLPGRDYEREPGYLLVQPRIRLKQRDGEVQTVEDRGRSDFYSEKDAMDSLNFFMDALDEFPKQFPKRVSQKERRPTIMARPSRWQTVLRHMQSYSNARSLRWKFSAYRNAPKFNESDY